MDFNLLVCTEIEIKVRSSSQQLNNSKQSSAVGWEITLIAGKIFLHLSNRVGNVWSARLQEKAGQPQKLWRSINTILGSDRAKKTNQRTIQQRKIYLTSSTRRLMRSADPRVADLSSRLHLMRWKTLIHYHLLLLTTLKILLHVHHRNRAISTHCQQTY